MTTYRLTHASCRCGNSLAWMAQRPSGAWETIGCVCHHTPPELIGADLVVHHPSDSFGRCVDPACPERAVTHSHLAGAR